MKKKIKKSQVQKSKSLSFASALSTASAAPAVSSSRQGTSSAAGHMSFSQLITMFAALFVGNAAVVYVASMIFPTQIVLGTHLLSPLTALVYSMGVLSLFLVAFVPVIEVIADVQKMKLTDMHWMALYAVLNVGLLWILSRFAEMLGFGAASWMTLLVLGLVLNVVQGLLVKNVVNKAK